MPTYEYRCVKGHTFEEFQSILADPVQVCPICGAHVERIISGGTGMIFKGSGFYITDYAHKNTPGGSHSKSGKSYSSEAASDSMADSTPAPKTETKPSAETTSKPDSPVTPKSEDKKSKPEG